MQPKAPPQPPTSATVDVDLDLAPQAAAPAGHPLALPPGHVLHEYTLEAVLGVGGFGITYLARDQHLQCQVAIKEYLPGELATRGAGHAVVPRSNDNGDEYREGLARFLAETRVLASFRHPHIVRVNRFFEANNTAYMVMDYEQGQPLRHWVKAHGPADEAQLRRMFGGLLDGLEQVHQAGMVHRDIKPSNIYVRDSDTSLVLLDFGSARPHTQPGSGDITSMVTPGFAPFEQYHARGAQGPWSDLYAIGGVLYWMVTGHKPLEAPSRVKEDSQPLASQAARTPYSDEFLHAIDWALCVDEHDRPQSVAAFRPVFLGQQTAPRRPKRMPSPAAQSDGDTVRLPSMPPAPAAPVAAAPIRPLGWRWPLLALGGALSLAVALLWVTRGHRAPTPAATPAAPASASTRAGDAAAGASSDRKPAPPARAAQGSSAAFACSDLPFALRVTCTIEGKEVIRRCAPDLRHWDHERPGCRRQGAQGRE